MAKSPGAATLRLRAVTEGVPRGTEPAGSPSLRGRPTGRFGKTGAFGSMCFFTPLPLGRPGPRFTGVAGETLTSPVGARAPPAGFASEAVGGWLDVDGWAAKGIARLSIVWSGLQRKPEVIQGWIKRHRRQRCESKRTKNIRRMVIIFLVVVRTHNRKKKKKKKRKHKLMK